MSDVLNSQANNVEVLEKPNRCCEVLRSLLQDPSTHNVMFVTSDGGSVSGHKAILNSAVFHAMFSDNVHTSGEMEISLNSISGCRDAYSHLSYIHLHR